MLPEQAASSEFAGAIEHCRYNEDYRYLDQEGLINLNIYNLNWKNFSKLSEIYPEWNLELL